MAYMKIMGIVGTRRSGKTTTITMIIEELRNRGYKVGTIKTINCPVFSMDDPKSNTARHKAAGADFAVARGKGETDISYPRSMDQNEIILRLAGEDIDYLILEGDLSASVPRIVCGHKQSDVAPRITSKTFLVSGRIADVNASVCGIRAISAMQDISALCDEIIDKVTDSNLPISLDEDTSANTLNCQHACESDNANAAVERAFNMTKGYNFDKLIDREGTDCVKWDDKKGLLPMWIADMDFETAPAIKSSIINRASHGVFGYSLLPDSWYEAYINWWKNRHGLDINKEELLHVSGVLPIVSVAISYFTNPGDKVVMLSPMYNHFYMSISRPERVVSESEMIYENGDYRIDWEDLEAKLSEESAKLFILCNPHNPIGRAWDKETLERIGELCNRHGVLVVSDEIHCDLTDPGVCYVPFASLSDECRMNSISCLAPTKAFNIAGIHTAAALIPNKEIRDKVNNGFMATEVGGNGAFAAPVTLAAFNESGEWLDELREYICENKRVFREYVNENIPQLSVCESNSNYLLWVNISQVADSSKDFCEYMKKEFDVWFTPGAEYGTGGDAFIRVNVATQRSRVMDGLERLKGACESYDKEVSNV